MTATLRLWWQGAANVWICPCGTPIQRTVGGTLEDGKRVHLQTVHGGRTPAALVGA